MAQDPDSTPAEAIGELVDELLRATATLSPLAPATTIVRRRLSAALDRALTGHTVIELLDAAGLVGCATDAIARELRR
ncbi:MAG TPA: hypothetical protein VGM33_26330 [Baekduia sp.]|jgi:hypothetical protein